ncbi:MAG TPA: LysE family transporter, partial [Candidatus Limnocylindria bacterium]|nr:LysE family transporter [Candidatus Limnocylindria bacterium]
KKQMGKWASVKNGFLTNALNPKATLFFLALFTQVIHTSTPLGIKILYGAEMSTMTFVWFAFVAVVLSHQKIKKPFVKVQHYVERTMGAVLILLGIKVALSKAK